MCNGGLNAAARRSKHILRRISSYSWQSTSGHSLLQLRHSRCFRGKPLSTQHSHVCRRHRGHPHSQSRLLSLCQNALWRQGTERAHVTGLGDVMDTAACPGAGCTAGWLFVYCFRLVERTDGDINCSKEVADTKKNRFFINY